MQRMMEASGHLFGKHRALLIMQHVFFKHSLLLKIISYQL